MARTPLAALLGEEIARAGSIPFRRFMELALYHPEYGYYRRARDPFGKEGDFFTAAQLQPVFGRLVAARIRSLWREAGSPAGFTVVELGPGRGELRSALSEWQYIPVEAGRPLPDRIRGVVFSNEFFDALPVDVFTFRGGWRELRVKTNHDRFVWIEGGPPEPAAAGYLARYFPRPEEGRIAEAPLAALAWMERIAAALESGWVFTIDYGYTRAEAVRFPQGTLMSYRRHSARETVLETPGEQDITAHVPFTALEECGAAHGLCTLRLETLAQTLLDAGRDDQFAAALAAADPRQEGELRLQLKTLLFGMGETFRTLLQKKEGQK